jgi:DNA-binding beta-propeller fold protein YncE
MSKTDGVSRRQMMKAVGAAGVGVALGGCVTVGTSAGRTGSDKKAPRYRVVKDWPQLPKTIVFDRCLGIATDSADKVYMVGNTKEAGCDVYVFAPDGKLLTTWKNKTIGQGHGLRILNDRIWITDIEHHQVSEFTLDGKLVRAFGERGKAGESETQFKYPTDIAFAPNGDLYIADGYGNSRIVCLSPKGEFKFAWGKKGNKAGEFFMPHNIAVDGRGRVYVADRGNQRIQVFDAAGRFIAEWLAPARAFGVTVHSDGIIAVADGDGHRIMLFSPDGRLLSRFGEAGGKPGQFQVPHSLHVDKKGDLFVVDVSDAAIETPPRMQKFVQA